MKVFKKILLAAAAAAALSTSASAAEYTKVWFYVDTPSDATQYMLFTTSSTGGVDFVGTHTAGNTASMETVTDQFESLPTYSNGELCFSSASATATNVNVNDIAGSCRTVQFFYIEGDSASDFFLYYLPASGGSATLSTTVAGSGSTTDVTSTYPNLSFNASTGAIGTEGEYSETINEKPADWPDLPDGTDTVDTPPDPWNE